MLIDKVDLEGISIKEFFPKKASRELWNKKHIFFEDIKREISPKDKLPERKSAEKSEKLGIPDFQYTRWIIFKDKTEEEIIASCNFVFFKEDSPNYADNKGNSFLTLFVKKDYRRQGLGKRLLRKVAMNLRKNNFVFIRMTAVLKSGENFCEKYGAKLTNIRSQNRLYMEEINWDMINQWISVGKKRNPDVTLESFHIAPDENLKEYCELLTELENETPSLEETENKTKESFTPKRYRGIENYMAKSDSEIFTIRSIEPDGKISGLTEIYYSKKDQLERINTGLTGVKSIYRGRGLGKWLKASMMLHIKKHLPKAEYITTGNADHNDPMLSINNRLGFKPYSQSKNYKFEIEDLIKRLNS